MRPVKTFHVARHALLSAFVRYEEPATWLALTARPAATKILSTTNLEESTSTALHSASFIYMLHEIKNPGWTLPPRYIYGWFLNWGI